MKQPGRLLGWLAVALFAAFLFAAPDLRTEAGGRSAASASPVQQGEAPPPLFPEFRASRVTAVLLSTPQATFDLRRSGETAVSVNGRRGDRDVFLTLLDHIASIDFTPTAPFDAQEAPLLVLTLRADGAPDAVLTFYDDDAQGEHARLVAAYGGDMRYGMTDGWRVGTLMMACEGVRIQDAAGKEMPLFEP